MTLRTLPARPASAAARLASNRGQVNAPRPRAPACKNVRRPNRLYFPIDSMRFAPINLSVESTMSTENCHDYSLARSHKLLQKPLALTQGAKTLRAAAFVGAVLDFDAHGAGVARVGQSAEERAPGDVAQAGQLRRVPAQAHDAVLIDIVHV